MKALARDLCVQRRWPKQGKHHGGFAAKRGHLLQFGRLRSVQANDGPPGRLRGVSQGLRLVRSLIRADRLWPPSRGAEGIPAGGGAHGRAPSRTYRFIRAGDIGGLGRAGCLYRPDPVLQEEAWQRLSGNTRAYSLCGITHTLSSTGAQRALGRYFVAPYEEWDAVICTSHAVRRAVDHISGRVRRLPRRTRRRAGTAAAGAAAAG